MLLEIAPRIPTGRTRCNSQTLITVSSVRCPESVSRSWDTNRTITSHAANVPAIFNSRGFRPAENSAPQSRRLLYNRDIFFSHGEWQLIIGLGKMRRAARRSGVTAGESESPVAEKLNAPELSSVGVHLYSDNGIKIGCSRLEWSIYLFLTRVCILERSFTYSIRLARE